MSTDIAELGLYVDSSGIVRATRAMDKMQKQGKKTEQGAEKLQKRFGLLKTAAVAFAGSLVIRKFVNTSAAFESMAVSLKTVTGSSEKATMAMQGILKFAKNTPFQVKEITDSFIKLKALGIEPTEESLISFGNTSSAMGKSLNQMIEAVADASTGEFERLKEFGIKSKTEGDKVSFTFQGITTTVAKNSQEITGYLESIGTTNFSGAMEEQMDTVNGAFSNAGDSIDALAVALGDAGMNAIVKDLTLSFSGLVNAMADFISPSAASQMETIHEKMKAINDQLASRAERGLSIDDERRQLIDLGNQYVALGKQKAESEGGIDIAGKTSPEQEKAIQDAKNKAKLDSDIEYALNKQQYDADVKNNAVTAAKDESTAKKQAMGETFGTLAVLTASSNKKMFKIGKAASIASAVINTHEAVSKTMAKTPYPWNIPLAAAQVAAGAVQVQAIRSQTFGQAHSGTDFVKNTGSYQLERGEMVVDKGTSADVRNKLVGAGGSGNTVNVSIMANDLDSFQAMMGRSGQVMWNTMLDKMNEEGVRFA